MRRLLLPVLTLGLLGLVLADRLSHVWAASLGTTAVVTDSVPAGPTRSTAQAATPPAESEKLVRLAIRQQLSREAGATYIDSLLATTDSVVRRWPDRTGPLKVAIIGGEPRGWEPGMADNVRVALQRWQESGIGVRFEEVADSSAADITVRWIDRFPYDRAGQTDLTWDQLGRVRHAAVALALRTSVGLALPERALTAVAVHETGHALGLPHSADSMDVMFPATRTGTLSDRDQRTALLLYRLAPGPIR